MLGAFPEGDERPCWSNENGRLSAGKLCGGLGLWVEGGPYLDCSCGG